MPRPPTRSSQSSWPSSPSPSSLSPVKEGLPVRQDLSEVIASAVAAAAAAADWAAAAKELASRLEELSCPMQESPSEFTQEEAAPSPLAEASVKELPVAAEEAAPSPLAEASVKELPVAAEDAAPSPLAKAYGEEILAAVEKPSITSPGDGSVEGQKEQFLHMQSMRALDKLNEKPSWKPKTPIKKAAAETYIFHRWQPVLKKAMDGTACNLLVTLVLLLNVAYMGVRTESRMQLAVSNIGKGQLNPDHQDALLAVDILFLLFYSVDVALKLLVYQTNFWRGQAGLLRVWEFVLVFFDLFALASLRGLQLSALRILQLLGRSVGLMRQSISMQMLTDLRAILVATIYSLGSFCSAMALMLMFMYLAAVIFVEGVAAYLETTSPDNISPEVLAVALGSWGSIGKAMLTEFKAISGGGPWGNFLGPIEAAGSLYLLIFLFYIAFMVVSLTKIVTGFFVQKAKDAAMHDFQVNVSHHVAELFEQLDQDGSGTIGSDEFAEHLGDEKVQDYFRMLNIDQRHARILFDLMDRSSDGQIDIDEFVAGCQSFGGFATNIDVSLALDLLKLNAEQLELVRRGLVEGSGNRPPLETNEA